MNLLKSTLFFLLIPFLAFGQPANPSSPSSITDGSTTVWNPWQVTFVGSTVSDDGDGSGTVTNVSSLADVRTFRVVSSDSGTITAYVSNDSYLISGAGIASTAVSGKTLTVTATEAQQLFNTVSGDSGTVVANQLTDSILFQGGGINTTVASGKTLSITATEAQKLFTVVSGDSGTITSNVTEDSFLITGSGIASTVASGKTLTVTATEADTLQTVGARGSTYVGGYVGIGYATPDSNLHVGGTFKVTGNISAESSINIGNDLKFADIYWNTGDYIKGQSLYEDSVSDDAIDFGNGAGQVNRADLPPYQQTVTVAKSGGDYTTIQGAIDSITDNATGKRYTVYVYPGTYIENVVMEEYVSLKGFDHEATTITSTSGITVTTPPGGGDVLLQDLKVTSTPTADGAETIRHTSGELDIYNCYIRMTSATNGVEGVLVNIDGGEVEFHHCDLKYDFDGSVGSSTQWHRVLDIDGTTTFHMADCLIKIDVADIDDTVVCIDEAAAAAITSHVSNCDIHMNLSHASYSGLTGFMYAHGTSTVKEMNANVLNMETASGTGTAYGVYMDTSAGNGVMFSTANQIHIAGFANDYGLNIAAGDTFNSHFDDVVADGGNTGAGTVVAVQSPSDGNLIITGDIISVTNITGTATTDVKTLLEDGNAVYNSTESCGGELGGTWASPTIDDNVTVTGWNIGTSTGTALDLSGTLELGSGNITTNTATGLLTHEAGGIELDISGIASGDVIAGASSGVAELVVGTAVTNDVLTIGSDNTLEWATPKANQKSGYFTRDTSIASGKQIISGIGFTAGSIIFAGGQNATNEATMIGFSTGTAGANNMNQYDNSLATGGFAAQENTWAIECFESSTKYYLGAVSVISPDSFTITWLRGSTPTGTIKILYLATE